VTDAAGPPRVHPSAPPLRPTRQCIGILASPHETPPRPLWPPVHTPLRLRAAPRVRWRAGARASHLLGRGLGRLHARSPCPPGGGRSVDGATAVLRVGARQLVDCTPGRPLVTPDGRRTPAVKGFPRARWLTARGVHAPRVTWWKPQTCPSWLAREPLAARPEA
jgi:hypothetical protein